MTVISNITSSIENITSSINTFISKRLKTNDEKANDYAEEIIANDSKIIAIALLYSPEMKAHHQKNLKELIKDQDELKNKFNKYD